MLKTNLIILISSLTIALVFYIEIDIVIYI